MWYLLNYASCQYDDKSTLRMSRRVPVAFGLAGVWQAQRLTTAKMNRACGRVFASHCPIDTTAAARHAIQERTAKLTMVSGKHLNKVHRHCDECHVFVGSIPNECCTRIFIRTCKCNAETHKVTLTMTNRFYS